MCLKQTDAGKSDPYVPLCFAGDTKMEILDTSLNKFFNKNIQVGLQTK